MEAVFRSGPFFIAQGRHICRPYSRKPGSFKGGDKPLPYEGQVNAKKRFVGAGFIPARAEGTNRIEKPAVARRPYLSLTENEV